MNPFLQVSGDAQAALEEFSTEFYAALAAADPTPWSTMFGLYKTSSAIQTTYPIPVSAAGYVEENGNDPLRSLYTRSLSMQLKRWVDGVEEHADVIEAPDFIDWNGEPARIAREAARLPNLIVATLLNANANLSFYLDRKTGVDAGIALFSNSHPVNVFDPSLGTFDNDHSASDIDSVMMAAAMTRFRARKGANGRVMGLRVTDMLVPGALEQAAKDFLESDLMRLALLDTSPNTQGTTNNRFKGAVNLTVADELLDDDVIYLLDRNGPKPWIVQDAGAVEEIRLDKDSDYYFHSGKVAVKYRKKCDARGCLPHAIERITIT